MLYYLKETLASQFLVPMLRSAYAGNGVFQVNKISLNFFLMVQKTHMVEQWGQLCESF